MNTWRTYIIGFVLSIVLSVVAFGLVGAHLKTSHSYPSHELAVPLLIVLAIAQLLVQLLFFLHIHLSQSV